MSGAIAAAERLPSGPSADGIDSAYWEGLRGGRVHLPRCEDCGTWRAPGRPLCSACHSFATRWDEVSPTGTVYTWIRSHRAFVSELDVPAPYVTVLVALDDAPVRLLGILEGADDVSIGMPVRGRIEQPANSDWPILRWALGGAR
jgi:uncharacterized OB-fold protein